MNKPAATSPASSAVSPARRRAGAILLIALLAWLAAMFIQAVLPGVVTRGNDLFYDTYYRARPVTDMTHADVVLVVADDLSLQMIREKLKKGWPWPREFWGDIAAYVDHAGARAIAFDIVFTEPSVYNDSSGDDDAFAQSINALKTPVVFGAAANERGQWEFFAPPVAKPHFGAVNLGDDRMFRLYRPQVGGQYSLAPAAVLAARITPRLPLNQPFLLHYYGPYKTPAGKRTFQYVSASNVLAAQITGDAAGAKAVGITPDLFKDKIVVLGGIAKATFDLKSSPLSDEYPGPEVQATAIENILNGQRVIPAGIVWLWIAPLLAALLVSAGIVIPRRATLKVLSPVIALALLLAIGVWLFRGNATGQIVWLPPVTALLAIAVASLLAFAWTYLAEDRQRRFMLKALSKVVSPAVAEQLAKDPGKLVLGTTRGHLSILFTDLADFTTVSERMDVQQVGHMLNRYLGDMSNEVLAQDGTLDKYIGDAVMCFWNAPLPQPDHALRACRTALDMIARERKSQPDFIAMGASKIATRIGINTESVAVGFIGSSHLYNYTVLGDGVNLASRVEGANKFYGSQILITENTAELVRHAFHLRKIDVLRVKGKSEPMALFELLGEKGRETNPEEVPRLKQITALYEQAFALYQQQKWNEAEKVLLELLSRFGDDAPSKALLERIAGFRLNPPRSPWDGVFDSTEK